MTVTVTGGTGQSLATLNLSTSDLTTILASASPTLSPIVYPAASALPTVSATLVVPSSLSSSVINVSGLGTQSSVATGTGGDTVASGASPATSAAAGTDTVGLLNTLSNTVPLGFLPSTGTAASVAGSSGTASVTGGAMALNVNTPTTLTPASGVNTTLTGGVVPTTFNLSMDTAPGSGAGITDTIQNFNPSDTLNLGGSAANTQALSTYHIANGSGTFSLPDGTKVVLQGYAGPSSSLHLTT